MIRQSGVGTMPVAASAAKEWFAARCPDDSVSRIATRAGLGRVTLHQQLVRGNVSEASVVAIARSMGLSPIRELASFEPYAELSPTHPDVREALAFIDWPRLLIAVGMIQEGKTIDESDLGDPLFPDSSRVWVEAIDTGLLRKAVEEELGLASSNVATALRSTLKLPLALSFARNAGVPLASAFVVSGLLTPEEAGWSSDERQKALLATDTVDLLQMVGTRAAMAEKHLRRIRRFEEDLG
jgi:hypothetical protein